MTASETPRYLGPKTCPSCHSRLPRVPEHWGRQKVQRTFTTEDEYENVTTEKRWVWVWSTYCKPCTRKKNGEAQKRRRALAKLPEADRRDLEVFLRGPCACCGREKNKREMLDMGRVRGEEGEEGEGGKVIVCTSCLEFLTKADFSLALAKHLWFQLRTHISEELALDQIVAVRCPGRPRQWHTENPNIPPDAPHHMNCLISEREWRPVVKWLAALTNV